MKKVVIIGAGPAGITAGYQLLKESKDFDVTILEADTKVGGIAKTVEVNGNRMDLGGHRFFSKNEEVKNWWEEILSKQGQPAYDDRILKRYVKTSPGGPDPEFEDEVMLARKRVSSIYFNEKFFEYPVKINSTTVKNLGLGQTAKAGFSYIESSIFKKKEDNLENFYMNHFGKQLYQIFFEGYTEKLWGRHPSQISADWGAQRMKGITVSSILKDTSHKKNKTPDSYDENTSLSEEFLYPKLGPGQMWEIAAKRFEQKGGKIVFGCRVVGIETENNVIKGVRYVQDGQTAIMDADYVISSMPIKDLILGMKNVPANVLEVARGLPYRDFVILGLLVPKLKIENTTKNKTLNNIPPDCWIYVQDTSVKLGRIQIYNNWSPYLVAKPEETVWIGLEYFCNEGDYYWNQSDIQWQTLAVSELVKMGIIDDPPVILDFHKEMIKKAYPAYFDTYSRFDEIKTYLNMFPNLYCIGRNGQHRYNNMDHTMMTAFETVRNIVAGRTDKTKVWAVNMSAEYHESLGSGSAEPNKPIIYVEGAADNKTGGAARERDEFAEAVAAAREDSEKKKGFNPMMSIRDRLSIRSLRKPKQPSSAVNYALLSDADDTMERNSYRGSAIPVRSNYQEPATPISPSDKPVRRMPSGVRNNATMPEDTYVVKSAPVKKEATFAPEPDKTQQDAGTPVFTTATSFEEPKYEVPAEKKAPEKKEERTNITPGYYGDPFEDIDVNAEFYDTAELPVDEVNKALEEAENAEAAPAETAFEAAPFVAATEELPAEVETAAEEIPAEAETVEEEIPAEAEVFAEEIPVENETFAEEIPAETETFAEEIPVETVAEEIPVADETAAPVEEKTEEPVSYVVASAKYNPNEKKTEEPAKESGSTGTLFTPRYFREEPVFEEPVIPEPVSAQPVFEEPVYETPAAPVYEEPVYETPAEPAYEEPVYEAPAGPAYTEPVYETPAEPVYTETGYETPAEQIYTEPVYDENAYAGQVYDNTGYVEGEGYQDEYYVDDYASRNEEYDSTYNPEYADGYGYSEGYQEETYYEQPVTEDIYPDSSMSVSNEESANLSAATPKEEGGIQKSNDFGSIFAMPTEDETRKKSTAFDMPYTPVAPTITISPKKEDKKEFLNQTGFSKEKVEKVLKTEITLKPKKEEKKEEPQVMVVSVPKPSYHIAKGVFTPKPITEEEKRKIEEEERAKRPIAPSINFKKAPEPPPEEEPKKQRPRKKNFARPAVPITADWESMNAKTLRELPEMEAKAEETPEIRVQKSDLPKYDIYAEMSYDGDAGKDMQSAGAAAIAASIESAQRKEEKAKEAKTLFTRASGFAENLETVDEPRILNVPAEPVEEIQPVAQTEILPELQPELQPEIQPEVQPEVWQEAEAPVQMEAQTAFMQDTKPAEEAAVQPAIEESVPAAAPEAPAEKAEVTPKPAPVPKKNIQDIEVPKDLFANARVIAVIKNGVKTSTTGEKTDAASAQPVKKTIQKYTSDFETTTVKSIRKLRAKRQEEAIQSVARMLEGTDERRVVSPRPKKNEGPTPAPSVANIFASTSFMSEDDNNVNTQNAVTEEKTEELQNIQTAPVEENVNSYESEPAVETTSVVETKQFEETPQETVSLAEAKRMAEEAAPEAETKEESSFFTLDLRLKDGSHRVVKELDLESVKTETVEEVIETTAPESTDFAEEATAEETIVEETIAEETFANEDDIVADLSPRFVTEPEIEFAGEAAEAVQEPVAETTQTVAEVASEAAPEVEEEKPVSKTRRTSRKPKTETAEGEEAPKKRTRKSTKTAADELSDGSADGEVKVEAVKKPRKPRAKKTEAVDNQLTLSDVSEGTEASDEAKPKRTYKRKPKTTEVPAEPENVTETGTTDVAADTSGAE